MQHFDPVKEAEYLREREARERKSASVALTDSARRHHEEMAQQYALMVKTLVESAQPAPPKRRQSFLGLFG